jgi:hypothetical protein
MQGARIGFEAWKQLVPKLLTLKVLDLAECILPPSKVALDLVQILSQPGTSLISLNGLFFS